jgi:hypothetical protein
MAADLSGKVVLRWDSASSCAALLEPGGIDAVWLRVVDEAAERACRAAGAEVIPPAGIRLLPLDQAGQAQTGEAAAIRAGVWPGAQAAARGASGAVVAGATQRAWVDANGYLIAYLRAVCPGQPPVLGYLPDREAGVPAGRVVSYESLELALVEAWCAGGNFILAPDSAYREALLAGDARAAAAWKQLGHTARWLKERRDLFRRPPMSTITVLVEPGDTTAEIANLLFRHSGSPELVSAARIPQPGPARRVVVAAGIARIAPEQGRILLAHARAGATVVADRSEEQSWWRAGELRTERSFEDREFHRLGNGRLVTYNQAVADPGDFALDVLDLAAGHRPVRVFDASAVVATVSQGAARGSAILSIVNYGSPARSDTTVHVSGTYSSATLLRPESQPAPLRTYRRGGSTEVVVPRLSRVAVAVFGG